MIVSVHAYRLGLGQERGDQMHSNGSLSTALTEVKPLNQRVKPSSLCSQLRERSSETSSWMS